LAAANVAITLCGLVQAKLTALLLGPSGMGVLAQLLGLLSLSSAILASGPGPYLVRLRALSRGRERDTYELDEVIALTLAGAALLALGMAALAPLVASVVLGDSRLWWAVVAVALALVIGSLTLVIRLLLQGDQHVSTLSTLDVSQAAMAMFAVPVLFAVAGTNGALVAGLFTAVCVAALALVLYTRRIGEPLRWAPRFPSPGTIRLVSMFSLATLLATFAYQGSFLVVRSELIHVVGLHEAGLYHAAASISLQVVSSFLTVLSVYMYPRLSSLATNPELLLADNERFLVWALSLFTPLAVIVITTSPLLVEIVLSSSFTGSTRLLQAQLAVDALRLISWSVTMPFLPLGRPWPHAAANLIWSGSFALGSVLGLGRLGLYAPIAAAAAAHLAMFVYSYIVLHGQLGYRLPRPALRLLLTCAITFGAALLLAGAPLNAAARTAVAFGLTVGFVTVLGRESPPWLLLGRAWTLVTYYRTGRGNAEYPPEA